MLHSSFQQVLSATEIEYPFPYVYYITQEKPSKLRSEIMLSESSLLFF